MNERDYSKDIIIDENDLENEWLTHPSLYLYYAEAHAEAVYKKDIKKSTLDYTYSILYDDIKTNWRDHFSSKPTEPAAKEWIVRNPKYRKAEKEFIEATRNANVMLNVKNAFEHRKHALSNVVSLMITGFHSEPKNKAIKRKQKGGHKAQKETLSDNKDNGIRATTRKQRKRKE
jgi:hypothetical protein